MEKHRSRTEKVDEKLFSVHEAADFLHVSVPFLMKQVESGRFQVRNAGAAGWIRAEDLQTFRASLRQESEAALQALADEGQALGI